MNGVKLTRGIFVACLVFGLSFAHVIVAHAQLRPKTQAARVGRYSQPVVANQQVLFKLQVYEIRDAPNDDEELDLSAIFSREEDSPRVSSFDLVIENSKITRRRETPPDANGRRLLVNVLQQREAKLLKGLLRASTASKLVSEPHIVTMNNRPARFMSGGEIPIHTPTISGKTAIEFREFGNAVELTPRVLDDQRLELKLTPTSTRRVADGKATMLKSHSAQLKAAFNVDQTLAALLPLSVGNPNAPKSMLYIVEPEFVEAADLAVGGPNDTSELREIHEEVKRLRQDVARLIEILDRR